MPTPQIFPWGPFQPLGVITVATAGVPVPMTQNLGAKGTYYSSTGGSEFAMQFQQIWLYASSGNTGNIYMMVPGQPASNTSAIIWKLTPGQYIYVGSDSPSRNAFDLNVFWFDADTSGNSVLATGYVGT